MLELGDYRNADELLLHSIEELNKYEKTIDEENWEEKLKQAKIDEIVYFGECEINGISDGKEKIPWRVIYKEGNRALIISESVLTVVPFCGQRSSGVNWVNSFLRKWLNEDFYTTSFSSEEKSLISITEIDSSNEYSSQEVTNDYLFILSVDELEKYLNENNIGGHPTVAVRLTYDNQISENDMISYWTRTMMPNNVFVVDDNNSFMDVSGTDDRGVRPALWLEFSD